MEEERIVTLTEKLKETKTEKLKEVEKDFSQKEMTQESVMPEKRVEKKREEQPKKYFNVFSSSSFKEEKSVVTQKSETKAESSSIIEKPNYDFIEPLTSDEAEKIYKIEKQEKVDKKSSKFGKRLRIALFSLVMAVCGIWGIANIVNINTVKSELDSLSNIYYNINLPSYLRNLAQLDAVNQDNMENLFQTIPEEAQPPTQIEAKSNWFDRFCEFLAGLFGG